MQWFVPNSVCFVFTLISAAAKHECDECGGSFLSKSALEAHKTSHNGGFHCVLDTSLIFLCLHAQPCLATSAALRSRTRITLRTHKADKHGNSVPSLKILATNCVCADPFVCVTCGLRTHSEQMYRLHTTTTHKPGEHTQQWGGLTQQEMLKEYAASAKAQMAALQSIALAAITATSQPAAGAPKLGYDSNIATLEIKLFGGAAEGGLVTRVEGLEMKLLGKVGQGALATRIDVLNNSM